MKNKFLLLTVFLSIFYLDAREINSVKIVVNNQPITSFDISKAQKESGYSVSEEEIKKVLIRQILEEEEAKKYKIKVSSQEVIDFMTNIARSNNFTYEQFIRVATQQFNITKDELFKKMKKQLISQKLYQVLASFDMKKPTAEQIKIFYELHKDKFAVPKSFQVTEYSSLNQAQLRKQIMSPMSNISMVSTQEKILYSKELSSEVLNLLLKTKDNSYTQIIPSESSFILYFVKSRNGTYYQPIKNVENIISQNLFMNKRNRILQDYFNKLEAKAEIIYIK
jgi:parvulin-like peptidyl-prolyl isomerase